MNCPIDGTELLITHRQNIEIDYCPKCRGIWLDRGELDKLIERSSAAQGSREPERDRRDERRYDDDDRYYKGKRKRSSFLEELFDF
jgi:hypothetical protein